MNLPHDNQKSLDPGHESSIRSYIHKREALLAPLAAISADAVRRHNRKPDDIRTPYSRDADRIIHTRAYTRYIDKTQVFSLVENDHITHRVIHVQLVSKIARTIGRCLRLNEDLIEAIALGHDIGHIPYGHFGESCLSAVCEQHGIGRFFHNVQSVQFLDRIEDCDLTMQVLDGILCHNGEADDVKISPEPCTDWLEFDRKVQDNADGRRSMAPMTLEGCVVKFADTIAYIGRDLQDAREVGLIGNGVPLPQECRDILGIPTGKSSTPLSTTFWKTVIRKIPVIYPTAGMWKLRLLHYVLFPGSTSMKTKDLPQNRRKCDRCTQHCLRNIWKI